LSVGRVAAFPGFHRGRCRAVLRRSGSRVSILDGLGEAVCQAKSQGPPYAPSDNPKKL
jgi:hypothetical protein